MILFIQQIFGFCLDYLPLQRALSFTLCDGGSHDVTEDEDVGFRGFRVQVSSELFSKLIGVPVVTQHLKLLRARIKMYV